VKPSSHWNNSDLSYAQLCDKLKNQSMSEDERKDVEKWVRAWERAAIQRDIQCGLGGPNT
jgi:hypothetical protein